MSAYGKRCCHSWYFEHEPWPSSYLSRLSPRGLLNLGLAALALGAFCLSWLILQYAAERIEGPPSNDELLTIIFTVFGAVFIPSVLLCITIFEDYVSEKCAEIESVKRYEKVAKLAVNRALFARESSLDSLRRDAYLSRPPRKPQTYELTPVPRDLATDGSGPRANYVCVCITVAKPRDPTVELEWVEATSVNMAFNALAPSHGWDKATCEECKQEKSVAYLRKDSLVLIRRDDWRHSASA